MRIAIDIRHLAQPHHTGIARYTVTMIEALAKHYPEHEYLLVSAGREKARQFIPSFSSPSITFLHIPLPQKILAFLLFIPSLNLEQFLPKKERDFAIWILPNAHFFRTKKPYILTIHDMSFVLFPYFFTFKQRLWHKLVRLKYHAHKASSLFTVSQTTKRDLIRLWNIPSHKIQTVHPFVLPKKEETLLNPTKKSSQKYPPFFLTLSSKEPRKNLLRVVKAFELYKTHHPKSPEQLILAGGASWKSSQLKKTIMNSHFSKEIHCLGNVSEQEKVKLLQEAQVLLFPSIYEGFGIPPLEAFLHNTPVIASFAGSLPEVLQNGALFVNPFHTSEIAEALHLLQKKSLQKHYKNAGRLRAKAFTEKRLADRVYQTCKQQVQGKK